MKITKQRLQEIILEEMKVAGLEEGLGGSLMKGLKKGATKVGGALQKLRRTRPRRRSARKV